MNITFDTREIKLIDEYKSKYNSICNIESLNIGDVHLYKENNLVCVIERKTMDDLSDSIMDKRYHEQKERMNILNNSVLIIYIIENFNKKNKNGIKYEVLLSSMCSTMIKNKYFVFRTKDICETATVINLCCKKFETTITNESPNSSYILQLASKNSCKLKENIWQAMLCCIPGISLNLAKTIALKYSNFETLYNKYTQEGRNIQFLTELQMIGEKLSLKIEEHLFSKI
jgi:ERCC4-type nuclease